MYVSLKGVNTMSDCCLPHDHGGVFEHGLEKMPTMEAFSLAADVFKQLDDPSRLKIFWPRLMLTRSITLNMLM